MSKQNVHEGIVELSKSERVELIFRWHNAIVIERVLSIAANDEYKFDGALTGDLKFSCGDSEVIASKNGELLQVNDERLDIEMLKPVMMGRLSRTNDMIDGLGDF